MEIKINMENLEDIIRASMEENLENVIAETVRSFIKTQVEEKLRTTVESVVNDKLTEYVNEYITTTQIVIGGGYWDEDKESFTVEQYIKKKLHDQMEKQLLIVPNHYSNSTKTITFAQYVKEQFDAEKIIKDKLDKFLKETKDDINQKIKTTFTAASKDMLSETVFNVLMNNETYRKMQENVACIADKRM